MSQADTPQKKAIASAEEILWEAFAQTLRARGAEDTASYLQYWLQAKAEEVTDDGPYRKVRFSLYQRLSDYAARYNAYSGEQMSWMFDALMEDLDTGLDEDACLSVAREAAAPPEGAVLEVSQYEEQADASVFVARWGHVHKGVPVEKDYIQVLVNGKLGLPFAVHRKWHQIDETMAER